MAQTIKLPESHSDQPSKYLNKKTWVLDEVTTGTMFKFSEPQFLHLLNTYEYYKYFKNSDRHNTYAQARYGILILSGNMLLFYCWCYKTVELKYS